ncbi:peptide/nickel transport system substrate-binding protein [Nocardiopsis sp. Huas11]|uniref:ABC transporter substrate-binding protein n=1 Tax=Nocardiopsis sp. Huas11 TaxID=2183912 RepID=UPI000EB1F020|nr:ABC transporter substrate-binding protein [Nocardiopsis sp. Huas11]RKS05037.1 peptide/nickel transport system substrate-binding protein [Nocardiopsis sp. Huas11]
MQTKTRINTGVAAAGALVLMLTGCAGSSADTDASSLTIGTMTVPQSLDPAEAMGSAMPYFQAVYDTLVKREPDGGYTPMLATEWTYDESLTELTLTLREDVTFDDGTPFDAEAVRANLERFRDGGGGQAQTMALLEEVEVVDDTTVVLHLEQPNPAMVFYLSDAAGLMANPAAFDGDSLTTDPDGTGPYELDQDRTAVGTTWVYTRADGYWGEDLPYDEVSINLFDNENAIVNGVRTGQINAALLQDVDQQAVAESDEKVETQPQDIDYQGIILFDRDGHIAPELAEPEVRQAINHAVDRETMLEQLRDGQGETTSQIFGPQTDAYDPELDTYYDHDPERARELLADAGYPDGFALTLPRMSEIVSDPLATSLQSDLADVGIDLTWDNLDSGSALNSIFTEQAYPGMVMNNAQPAEDWVTTVELVLPGTFNFFGTTDETVQDLTHTIQTSPDGEAADQARELNRHLVEQGWFVPFYRMTFLHVSDGTVDVEPQSGMAVPALYNYAPAE